MIGIQDYAHAAQLQREYEDSFSADLPRCEKCGGEFFDDELVNGICEECAKDLYNIALGREFVREHINEWHDWLAGEDMTTCSMSQYMALVNDFCFELMDEWRAFVSA